MERPNRLIGLARSKQGGQTHWEERWSWRREKMDEWIRLSENTMIIKSFGWHVDPNLWYHKIENLVKIECIPSIPAFQFFYSKHHLMRLFCVFPILCFATSYQSYSCILPFLYFEFLHIFGTEIQYIPQVWIIPSSNHKEMKSCSHFIKDYIRTNPSLILAN